MVLKSFSQLEEQVKAREASYPVVDLAEGGVFLLRFGVGDLGENAFVCWDVVEDSDVIARCEEFSADWKDCSEV